MAKSCPIGLQLPYATFEHIGSAKRLGFMDPFA